MNKSNYKLNCWALAAILGVPTALSAFATESDDLNALKAEVQVLDQKIRLLEEQQHREQTNAAASATATINSTNQVQSSSQISVGANGLSFVNFGSHSDTNFAVQIHGVLQMDTRSFGNDDKVPGSSGFLLRRARPILAGTVYRDFDFLFVPDFGNAAPGNTSATPTPTIYDAFVNYHYSPEFQIQAGKFKTPIGLEQLQADSNIEFNERSLVTDLVPNRDLGFELHGDLDDGVVSYAVGIFNGVGDERNTSNYSFQENREFDGRLFAEPFKKTSLPWLRNFGAGLAGGWGQSSITNTLGLPNTTGGSLPGYTTDGQQQFFAYNPAKGSVVAGGVHWRLSPQGTYYYGPFGLLGEYAISDQGVQTSGLKPVHSANLQNTAWEIAGGWVLTGEDASFNGVIPQHPFDPRTGNWGAFQIVARYAELAIDQDAFPWFSNPKTSASGAQAWAVGLNWYLNQNIRFEASYSHTTFSGEEVGGATTPPGTVGEHPENVFFTRLQLAF